MWYVLSEWPFALCDLGLAKWVVSDLEKGRRSIIKHYFYGTGQWVVNFKSISIYPDWLYSKYAQMQRKQRNTGNSWNDLHRSINTGLSANCVNGLTLQDNH